MAHVATRHTWAYVGHSGHTSRTFHTEQAKVYELWAASILDEVDSSRLAVELLTLVPLKVVLRRRPLDV